MPTRIYLVRHGRQLLPRKIASLARARRARLRLFNDVSHYEGMPARRFERRLSRWWVKPDWPNGYSMLQSQFGRLQQYLEASMRTCFW